VTRQEGDIAKFSPQGKFLNRIKTDVRSPRDIAIDPAGNIFLTNVSTIHIFSPDGKALKTIKADQAFGLDINASGDVFVASRPEVVKYRIEPDDQ
jgi:DNA-binding beta-propeller fold protein YncE